VTDGDILLSAVPEDRRDEFRAYITDLVQNDDHMGIDWDFLGFIQDYVNIAKLLQRKADVHSFPLDLLGRAGVKHRTPLTVYDVGCSSALQHILFDPRILYVGIDTYGTAPRFFRDGCRYVCGQFSHVAASLDVDRENAVGVANMSLLYGSAEEELRMFDATFRQKVIL
jgi:hypothetical protein